MEPGWVKIYTSNNFLRAELMRQALVENEIDAVLINRQVSGYQIGEVQVYVHQQNFEDALEVVIRNEN